jgi:cytochrome c
MRFSSAKGLSIIAAAMLAVSISAPAMADDGDEFKTILKKNDCTKCHTIEKNKKGPSYKKVAAKYKGKEAEGEAKIIKNITTGPKVKLEDGTEEEHKIIDMKDEAELKKFARWILSL